MRRLDTDRNNNKKMKKKKKKKRGNCGMLFVSLLGLFCLLFACICVCLTLFLWSVCSHEKCVKEVCRLDRRRVLFAKENPM